MSKHDDDARRGNERIQLIERAREILRQDESRVPMTMAAAVDQARKELAAEAA